MSCAKCGTRNPSNCDRWDCKDLQYIDLPIIRTVSLYRGERWVKISIGDFLGRDERVDPALGIPVIGDGCGDAPPADLDRVPDLRWPFGGAWLDIGV
jgi:hypothetical protein